MPDTMQWDNIPQALLTDCAQLVKANSIEGNKKDNITIIYTPADNLKVCTSSSVDHNFPWGLGQNCRKQATWLSAKFHFTMTNVCVTRSISACNSHSAI